jgi:hypothetical protein
MASCVAAAAGGLTMQSNGHPRCVRTSLRSPRARLDASLARRLRAGCRSSRAPLGVKRAGRRTLPSVVACGAWKKRMFAEFVERPRADILLVTLILGGGEMPPRIWLKMSEASDFPGANPKLRENCLPQFRSRLDSGQLCSESVFRCPVRLMP